MKPEENQGVQQLKPEYNSYDEYTNANIKAYNDLSCLSLL